MTWNCPECNIVMNFSAIDCVGDYPEFRCPKCDKSWVLIEGGWALARDA